MQPTYGNGFVENPTIEISQEGLRAVLTQIEAELLESEVYRRTMAGLQTMLGETASTAQILVKAVGREAVRLSFQQLAKQYKVIPVTSEGNQIAKQQEPEPSQAAPEQSTSEAAANTPATPTDSAPRQENPPKKATKVEIAAQKLDRERAELLRQVGHELRQAREARVLSIRQLHSQTLVPVHHIEALEAGRVDQLPEDIYVRGFIRRIGQALGMNGVAMAASIPEPEAAKSVIPSWYHSTAVPGGFQLSAVHLYLGYTALIAGAVGGLSWMSGQSTPGVSFEPDSMTPSSTSISQRTEKPELTGKPGLRASEIGIQAGVDIAPPEMSAF
jgi:ribosome-binding protein aMBF1 (putative translation factor)